MRGDMPNGLASSGCCLDLPRGVTVKIRLEAIAIRLEAIALKEGGRQVSLGAMCGAPSVQASLGLAKVLSMCLDHCPKAQASFHYPEPPLRNPRRRIDHNAGQISVPRAPSTSSEGIWTLLAPTPVPPS